MPAFDAIAHLYDQDDGRVDDDLTTVLAYARETGGPILELGVGTGRLALALAQVGYMVTGVDIAANMLAIARDRLRAAGLDQRVELVHSDFADLDLNQQYGLAICAYNSFLHLLTTADQLQALRVWHRHLRANGLLIIDVINPQLGHLAAADGSLVLAETWVDPHTGKTIQKYYAAHVDLPEQIYTIHRHYDEIDDQGGVKRTQTALITRILFRQELVLLLEHAGFQNIQLFGDHDLEPWQSDSPNIIAVASR